MTAGNRGGPRVLLGRIAGAHGIKGDVAIRSFTADPAAIASYGPLSDAAGARSFGLRVVRVTDKAVIVRIEGVVDRTAAEALKGVELYVDRARLPAAGEREFYHADLIGLAAVDADGRAIGEVVAVQNFGAGDLIEIRMAGLRETEFIPFNDAFVPSVDVAGGRIVVAMPVQEEHGPGGEHGSED
jgi:16S rRNA processing protein RimM